MARVIGAIAALSVALSNSGPAAARSANWLVLCGQKDSLTVKSFPQSRKDFVQYNITLVNQGRYAFTFQSRRDFSVFAYKRTQSRRGWTRWKRISNGGRPDRRSRRFSYFTRHPKVDDRGLQFLYQLIPVNKRRPLVVNAFASLSHCKKSRRRPPPLVRRDGRPPIRCPAGKRPVYSTGVYGIGRGEWLCQ